MTTVLFPIFITVATEISSSLNLHLLLMSYFYIQENLFSDMLHDWCNIKYMSLGAYIASTIATYCKVKRKVKQMCRLLYSYKYTCQQR